MSVQSSVRQLRDASHISGYDRGNRGDARPQACSRRRSRIRLSCNIPALYRPHPFQAPWFARLSRLSVGIALSTGMQPLLPTTSCGPRKWLRKMAVVWSLLHSHPRSQPLAVNEWA